MDQPTEIPDYTPQGIDETLSSILLPENTKGTLKVNNNQRLKWKNTLAIQRFYQIIEITGRNPDLLDVREGGMAIWRNILGRTGTGVYNEWRLQDDGFIHSIPETHTDFLFFTLNMPLKRYAKKKYPEVSDTVCYYPGGEMMMTGCNFYGEGVVALAVIKMLNEEKITGWQGRDKYAWLVTQVSDEWNEVEKSGDYRKPMPVTDALEKYIFE